MFDPFYELFRSRPVCFGVTIYVTRQSIQLEFLLLLCLGVISFFSLLLSACLAAVMSLKVGYSGVGFGCRTGDGTGRQLIRCVDSRDLSSTGGVEVAPAGDKRERPATEAAIFHSRVQRNMHSNME